MAICDTRKTRQGKTAQRKGDKEKKTRGRRQGKRDKMKETRKRRQGEGDKEKETRKRTQGKGHKEKDTRKTKQGKRDKVKERFYIKVKGKRSFLFSDISPIHGDQADSHFTSWSLGNGIISFSAT